MEKIEHKNDLNELKAILKEHLACTGSAKAKEILDNFKECAGSFKKIIPLDYKRMLKGIAKYEEQGASPESAEELAFKAFVEGKL